MPREKRPDPAPDALNLGPRSTQWLREIGVAQRSDLERLGAVLTYRILKDRFPGVSLNMLYGLEAALTGRTWRDLTAEERARLRQEAEAVRRSSNAPGDAIEDYIAQFPRRPRRSSRPGR